MATKVIRTGLSRSGSSEGSGNGMFVSIKDGESVVFSPLQELDEIATFDQHSFWEINPAVHVPCIREDCIPCSLGNDAKYRAFIPVVLKSGETKIISAGSMIVNQLVDIGEELDTIVGKVFKLSRKGTSLSTRYRLVAIGTEIDTAKYDVPDTISAIGSTDPTDIAKTLEKAGFYVPSESEIDDDVDDDGDDDGDETW